VKNAFIVRRALVSIGWKKGGPVFFTLPGGSAITICIVRREKWFRAVAGLTKLAHFGSGNTAQAWRGSVRKPGRFGVCSQPAHCAGARGEKKRKGGTKRDAFVAE